MGKKGASELTWSIKSKCLKDEFLLIDIWWHASLKGCCYCIAFSFRPKRYHETRMHSLFPILQFFFYTKPLLFRSGNLVSNFPLPFKTSLSQHRMKERFAFLLCFHGIFVSFSLQQDFFATGIIFDGCLCFLFLKWCLSFRDCKCLNCSTEIWACLPQRKKGGFEHFWIILQSELIHEQEVYQCNVFDWWCREQTKVTFLAFDSHDCETDAVHRVVNLVVSQEQKQV